MLRDDLIKGEGFSSDLSIIEDYDGMKGVRAYVSYMFEDDRLCGISVTLSNQNSSYTDSMIIENVLINSINYTERKMKILPVPYGMLERAT